jgi:ParB-like nuclease domain
MKKLNLDIIRLDGGTQARVALNTDVVAEYAAHLQEGDVFPPITVFHDGGDYWLADGFHRYMANKQNGATEIECDVRIGTLEDAKLYAYGANGKRGLSMSREDKRKVILLMLQHPEWSKWANTEIAKHIGVSSMTIGRVKSSLIYDAEKEPEVKKFNKQGEVKEINTTKLGRPKKEPVEPVVEEPKFDETQEFIDELTDTINALSLENQKLKDIIAVGAWDATEFEKMDIQETIEQLREQIRVLEIDNSALRESRDMFQSRNAELMDTVKSLQNKLKKAA